MQVKNPPPLTLFENEKLSSLLRAYLELNQLKQLYRQGWLQRGLPAERCESVAEHSFGVAALALLVADALFPGFDRERLLRMALLHDFGEIHAGDLTPADGVPTEEKRRRERASVERVLAELPAGDEYVALWREYEEGASAEARLLRQLDRLEMGLQALVYEGQGEADMAEFHATIDAADWWPELRAVIDELAGLRRG
jgi:putative hydrolase of HD superfamily